MSYSTPPPSPEKLSPQPDWTSQIQTSQVSHKNGNSFNIGVLPIGSSLYRVRPEDLPIYTHPIAWYSNYDLAATLEHGENIFKFTTPKTLRLLNMGDVATINTIKILFQNLGYKQELDDLNIVFELKNTDNKVYVYRKSYKNEDFRVAEALKKIFKDLQGWFHLEIPAHTQRGFQEAEVLLFDNSDAGIPTIVPLTHDQKSKVALRRSDAKNKGKGKAPKRPPPPSPPRTPRTGQQPSFTGATSEPSTSASQKLPTGRTKPNLAGFRPSDLS